MKESKKEVPEESKEKIKEEMEMEQKTTKEGLDPSLKLDLKAGLKKLENEKTQKMSVSDMKNTEDGEDKIREKSSEDGEKKAGEKSPEGDEAKAEGKKRRAKQKDSGSFERVSEDRNREKDLSKGSEDSLYRQLKKPKKKKSVAKKIVFGIAVIALIVIGTFGYSFWSEYSDTTSVDGKEITVDIKEGSTTREVGNILKEAGVIRYASPFFVKMYFSEYKGKLRYGTFLLNDGMCLEDIIKSLATGGALKEELTFTIPEGYSVEQTAKKLEQEGIMTAEEFLNAVTAAAANFPYAKDFPPKEQVFYQLQGFLYPDTYYLSEDMTAEELVDKILSEFETKFDESRQTQAAAAGMSVEEVLIRASLIQKETEKTEEYPIIAGVINNRLAQNMKLQFDSTVVYAMTQGQYGVSRVLYSDLKLDSPYNTYKNKGLPVGPICNPSMDAIDAVLHPDANEYLYFQTDMVKNDGSNLFFKTYEEHVAASATTQAAEKTTGATDEGKTEASGEDALSN